MIYPGISAEEWCRRYPGLSMDIEECPACGATLRLEVPYISKDFAGLSTPKCECGETDSCRIFVPLSDEMLDKTRMIWRLL